MKRMKDLLPAGMLFLVSCTNNSNQKIISSAQDSLGDTVVPTQTSQSPLPNDAVAVAPDHYKVLRDSLGIRIIEVSYQPGDSTGVHTHPEAAFYVVEGDKGIFTGVDGSQNERILQPGMGGIRPSETHAVKNTGTKPFKVILVEVSRGAAADNEKAEPDANKASPQLYKIKADSLGLRLLEINYKPGQSSPMHAHPDAAFYSIGTSTSEFTTEDGKKETYTLNAGTAMITPAGKHSVKNIGKTNTKGILVEVFRKRQQ